MALRDRISSYHSIPQTSTDGNVVIALLFLGLPNICHVWRQARRGGGDLGWHSVRPLNAVRICNVKWPIGPRSPLARIVGGVWQASWISLSTSFYARAPRSFTLPIHMICEHGWAAQLRKSVNDPPLNSYNSSREQRRKSSFRMVSTRGRRQTDTARALHWLQLKTRAIRGRHDIWSGMEWRVTVDNSTVGQSSIRRLQARTYIFGPFHSDRAGQNSTL